MKIRKYLISLIPLLFLGCTIMMEWPTDWDYRMPDETGNSTVENAYDWVAQNIQYKSDEEDSWQLPHETYEIRTGDCEDQALLLLYIFYAECKIEEAEFIIIDNEILEDHAVVRINETYYDPTNLYKGIEREVWETIIVLDYGEAMGTGAIR